MSADTVRHTPTVWDAVDGKVRMKATAPRTSGEISLETGLAINSDGTRVAICTLNLSKKNAERDRLESRPGLYQVEVWNIAKRRIDTRLQHGGSLSSSSALRFSPDDTTLAISALDAKATKAQIVQWTVNARKKRVIDWAPAQTKPVDRELCDVQYSLDGKLLAGMDGRRIAGWNVESQEPVFDFPVEQEVVSFRMVDNGKRIAAIAMLPGFDRTKVTLEELLKDNGADVIVFNAKSGKQVSRQRLPTRYLMLSADGKSVFGRPPAMPGETTSFTQWDVKSGATLSDDDPARRVPEGYGSAYEAEKRKASESQEKRLAAPGAMSANGATIVEEDLDVVRVWTTLMPSSDVTPAKKSGRRQGQLAGARVKGAQEDGETGGWQANQVMGRSLRNGTRPELLKRGPASRDSRWFGRSAGGAKE